MSRHSGKPARLQNNTLATSNVVRRIPVTANALSIRKYIFKKRSNTQHEERLQMEYRFVF